MITRLVAGVAGRLLRLPRARTRRVTVTRNIRVRVRDGVPLLTDHYAPDLPAAPTVLIRTPYGRGGPIRLLARLFAAHGFHVVVQSCRGTFGSGGTFEPLAHERADGLDTVDWLRRQPWYAGRFGMFGASYQGFTQWAVAAHVGDELRAMVAVVTTAATRDSTYAGGAFSLDTVLTWAELIEAQTVSWLARQVELKRGQPRLLAGLAHLPLAEADRIATGGTIRFFQDWLRHHMPGADYWRPRVFDAHLDRVRAPVAMVTGWHDIFLPAQLADYAALRAAGGRPYLTIGPWTHGGPRLLGASVREGLLWLRAHLAGEHGGLRAAPVRIHVGGAGGGWRDLPAWPPPAARTAWHLHAGGGLATRAPRPSRADGFWYDPSDPTPSLGGPLLVAQRAGRVDNRPVERRPDVLTYTSAPLAEPLEVIGPVTAEVYLRSALSYLDVFLRLCEVDRRGRSWNVCDGLVRVSPDRFPADGDVLRVPVPMWPVAHRFARGHRLRLQVCGGAHPRYARNPGTGEPLGTAVALRAGYREVLHDPAHPSAVFLPVHYPS